MTEFDLPSAPYAFPEPSEIPPRTTEEREWYWRELWQGFIPSPALEREDGGERRFLGDW